MGASKIKNFLRKYMMLIATVVVVIGFYFITDGQSLNPDSIDRLISQNAYVFVLGTGMLLCILTGGNIDLSVGSVVCLAGSVGAIIMDKKLPWPLAVAVMLVMGLLVGLWHGYWIAYVKVPPFIATLVGMLAFRGLANIFLKGKDVIVVNKDFMNVFGGSDTCYVPDFLKKVGPALEIGGANLNKTCIVFTILLALGLVIYTFVNRARLIKNGYKVDNLIVVIVKTVLIAAVILWFGYKLASYRGIPTAFIWIALILAIFAYITTKTTLGRNLYAVGGNEKATRLSGIDTRKVMFSAYTLMGVLAGFASILVIARGQKAGPTVGVGFEMDAIAACFIGGASAYGGTGSIGGVIIGATLMGVINQGMNIAATPVNYQKVVKGVVLILAVLFDILMQMKRKGAKNKKVKKNAIDVATTEEGGAKS
ncbi:MAG: sugar ABC transporter permease [Saccharofermentans sp.]|nr:sugar ABC transporter permease [Saccharofermentans sp.]